MSTLLALSVCVVSACASGATGERARIEVAISGPDDGRVSVSAPRTAEAGLVELSLASSGPAPHDAQLFRVDGERSGADIAAHLESADGTPWPRWLRPAGGVGATPPGRTRNSRISLQPGTYYVADTREPPDESGAKITGAARGGIARIELTGDGSDAALPRTRARIVAREHRFDVAGIRAGRNEVTFVNAGEEPHEAAIFALRPGASFQAANRERQALDYPTVETRGSALDLDRIQTIPIAAPGASMTAELSFAPGRYLIACYSVDREGGAPHAGLGMVAELTVPAR